MWKIHVCLLYLIINLPIQYLGINLYDEHSLRSKLNINNNIYKKQ